MDGGRYASFTRICKSLRYGITFKVIFQFFIKLRFLQAFCRILEKSYEEISNVKGVVDEGNIAAKFGQTADQICNSVKFH
jgi:hypothetical protein